MKPYYLYTNIDGDPRWHMVIAYEDSVDFVKEDFIEPMSIDEYLKNTPGSVAVEIPEVDELLATRAISKKAFEALKQMNSEVSEVGSVGVGSNWINLSFHTKPKVK